VHSLVHDRANKGRHANKLMVKAILYAELLQELSMQSINLCIPNSPRALLMTINGQGTWLRVNCLRKFSVVELAHKILRYVWFLVHRAQLNVIRVRLTSYVSYLISRRSAFLAVKPRNTH
jgi:hypothetical protein